MPGFLSRLFSKQEEQKPQQDVGSPPEPVATEPPQPDVPEVPRCPYCDQELEKMPSRKKKCKACGNSIHVVKLPLSGDALLVTEDDLPYANARAQVQYAIKRGALPVGDLLEPARRRLRSKFGGEPSDGDVLWAAMNELIVSQSRHRQWWRYRSTRLAMGDHLLSERKTAGAVEAYLEVCYFDLNGARDALPDEDSETEKIFPMFDRKRGDLLCSPTLMVLRVATTSGIEMGELEATFQRIASRYHTSLRMPLAPDKAWKAVQKELKSLAKDAG